RRARADRGRLPDAVADQLAHAPGRAWCAGAGGALAGGHPAIPRPRGAGGQRDRSGGHPAGAGGAGLRRCARIAEPAGGRGLRACDFDGSRSAAFHQEPMKPLDRFLSIVSWPRALVVLLACLCAVAQVRAGPVQITDDRGQVVTVPPPPRRVASLLPSLTEAVCALGECHRLVGVDRFSNWPDAVKQLPQLGGGVDPNIEAIAALKPDLVLLSTSTRARERLEALGLTVL